MSADWKDLSREAGFTGTGATLRIDCGSDRFHTVFVDDSSADAIRLWSIVSTRGDAPPEAALQSWKANRYRELVGFKESDHGRIIGECWLPTGDFSVDEWKLYVLTLARACDQLECQWTGRDRQ